MHSHIRIRHRWGHICRAREASLNVVDRHRAASASLCVQVGGGSLQIGIGIRSINGKRMPKMMRWGLPPYWAKGQKCWGGRQRLQTARMLEACEAVETIDWRTCENSCESESLFGADQRITSGPAANRRIQRPSDSLLHRGDMRVSNGDNSENAALGSDCRPHRPSTGSDLPESPESRYHPRHIRPSGESPLKWVRAASDR